MTDQLTGAPPEQLVGATRDYEQEFKVRSAVIQGLMGLEFWAKFTETKADDIAIRRAKSAFNDQWKWEAMRAIIFED